MGYIKEIMTWTLSGIRPRRKPRRRCMDNINELWNAEAQKNGTDKQNIEYDRKNGRR